MDSTRREFLKAAAAASAVCAVESASCTDGVIRAAEPAAGARLASGVKVGEVTDQSAIVWARLTRSAQRSRGPRVEGAAKGEGQEPLPAPVDSLEGACPGAAGAIRVRYGVAGDKSTIRETPWRKAAPENDFVQRFPITDLKPATRYAYEVETADPDGTSHGTLTGGFETAPRADSDSDVRMAFINCQKFHTRERDDGFNIYEHIRKSAPQFVVFTGDNVYYDSDQPRAMTADIARYHWQRCYSLPRHASLLRSCGSYWIKDDHDSHSDDVFPGRGKSIMGKFTFEEGLGIYRQQVPLGESLYRTHRWGRDLQIWLMEGRDFRSRNNAPDAPEKSIWGSEQKEWLKRTLKESDATWKLLISPTPIVGPDRPGKADNHSNAVFSHEGNEMRKWFAEHVPERFFVVCGDRHWQYHSVEPATRVQEFSIGAASDGNAGGTPGMDQKFHRYHKVQGGYLEISVRRRDGRSTVRFAHFDVRNEPAYAYEEHYVS